MVKHVMLLDCTLRDGAYLIDKRFGDNTIRGIIEGLMKARMDCIEIGFFQDEGQGEGKTVYLNSADAKKFVPSDKAGAMFTVLADCSRYSIDNLDECDKDSIDAVRECFFKAECAKAMNNCRRIMEQGYKCFVQPVDILGYSDRELLGLIDRINEVEPYCLSIVDTFGSMDQDDLHRLFEIINHNLIPSCKIGFHSHNNLQLSNALSQEFVRMTIGKREIIIDGTVSGMGRGAGNTPTELIAQYLVSKHECNYDIDAILDIIDDYMDAIRSRCDWGYSTQYFIAGCYSAHVNNVNYLSQKNSIRSKDIRYILNRIGEIPRKRYDYNLIEKTFLEYTTSDIDDTKAIESLGNVLNGRSIVVAVPGASLRSEIKTVREYIKKTNSLVISINFVDSELNQDYVYISNMRRYQNLVDDERFADEKKIIASNIKQIAANDKEMIVSFNRLVKCGFEHIDNSTLMVLRLLDLFRVSTIALAGFDGYSSDRTDRNYYLETMEISTVRDNPQQLNKEIQDMLVDYYKTRKNNSDVIFITESRFSDCYD